MSPGSPSYNQVGNLIYGSDEPSDNEDDEENFTSDPDGGNPTGSSRPSMYVEEFESKLWIRSTSQCPLYSNVVYINRNARKRHSTRHRRAELVYSGRVGLYGEIQIHVLCVTNYTVLKLALSPHNRQCKISFYSAVSPKDGSMVSALRPQVSEGAWRARHSESYQRAMRQSYANL